MSNSGYFQIQAKCSLGCPDHLPGEWRKSKNLPAGIGLKEAGEAMDAYAVEFWRSKPYRLVWIRPAYVVKEAVLVMKEIPE